MKRPLPHVVALGEVLWDLFPDGARFGGAPANFAHHVAALGGRVSLVTAVGGDAFGAVFVLGLLKKAKLLDIAQSACRVAEFVCTQPGATPKLPEAVFP
jgi:sugar/nucleoside kinase (ribokinase family)